MNWKVLEHAIKNVLLFLFVVVVIGAVLGLFMVVIGTLVGPIIAACILLAIPVAGLMVLEYDRILKKDDLSTEEEEKEK